MRSDLIEQIHHGFGTSKSNLLYRDSSRGEEFGGLTFQSVQRVEAEELMKDGGSRGIVERGSRGRRRDGFVEGFHHEILGVGCGETPEVYKEAVPGSAFDVSVLASLESEVRGAPREGGYDVRVVAEDIETSAHFFAG
jgi:hypothetical protein